MNETTEVTICPRCTGTQGMTLASGARLCFECRYEWTPGDDAPARVAVPLVPALGPDDVLGPPADVLDARAAQDRLDALIGTDVMLEGGQRATIVSFPDDDHVEVVIGHADGGDDRQVVDYNDVIRSIDPAVATPQVDEETQLAIAQAVAVCAGMILQAALETVATDDGRTVIQIPPSGWLPRDTDAWAVVEQGAAYASAVLIYAHELDRDIVAGIAADLIDNANNQKGGTET